MCGRALTTKRLLCISGGKKNDQKLATLTKTFWLRGSLGSVAQIILFIFVRINIMLKTFWLLGSIGSVAQKS